MMYVQFNPQLSTRILITNAAAAICLSVFGAFFLFEASINYIMIENKLSKFVVINNYYTSDCYMHQMRNNVRTIGLLKQSEKKDSKCTLFVAIVGYSPEINSS